MTAGGPSALLANVPASSRARQFAFGLMVLLLLSAGTMHFLHPSSFVQISPPFVPFSLGAVNLSGVVELLLGVGLLIPRLARGAALATVLLLVAVFPAVFGRAPLVPSHSRSGPSADHRLGISRPARPSDLVTSRPPE
jgi:uncharacterized membrane protein